MTTAFPVELPITVVRTDESMAAAPSYPGTEDATVRTVDAKASTRK
ncbi:hypothetical protein [Nocardia sp. SYP-A9097]|nr:hypothetical protein [Nocardia sp. SYP-A9097]